MATKNRYNLIFVLCYSFLFLFGIRLLFRGFPHVERFFVEGGDERLTLTYIMKFGTLNFAPTQVWHPPLYHYLTFIPITIFYLIGRLAELFKDKTDFVRFYFNNTHYFFLIGRAMSYIFYWLTGIALYKIIRLFFKRIIAHLATISYLLIPVFIFNFSTVRPETLLFLTTSIFFYFFLKFYLQPMDTKYLFIAAFFLGVSTAAKYNAIYLGVVFLFALIFYAKGRRVPQGFKIILFAFLGFFICDPFFIIKFNAYFYNLKLLANVEVKQYWIDKPAIFGLSHIRELGSLMYMNPFGFLILLLGFWRVFGRDKKLFGVIFFTAIVYELYFALWLRNYSPLRYLNPLLPMVALIFATGLNYIMRLKKKLILLFIMFVLTAFYNYLDIWHGLSIRPTYLQKARMFIEENIPEFTTICIVSDSHIPQLSMTEASYYHLVRTAEDVNDPICRLPYKKMENREGYDEIFKRLRVESMTKKPQYNLVRWDTGIETEGDVWNFLKRNDVKYIITITLDYPLIGGKKLEEIKGACLVKVFEPENRRAWGGTGAYPYNVYLYKVKHDL